MSLPVRTRRESLELFRDQLEREASLEWTADGIRLPTPASPWATRENCEMEWDELPRFLLLYHSEEWRGLQLRGLEEEAEVLRYHEEVEDASPEEYCEGNEILWILDLDRGLRLELTSAGGAPILQPQGSLLQPF